MGHQPADHCQNRRVRLLPQSHHPLKLRLVLCLSLKMLSCVIRRQILVFRRVIAFHINAVEHAGELISTPAHNALHSMGKKGVLQFLGIAGGHGGNRGGAEDGCLQQIHIAVHHNGAVVHPAMVQTKQVAHDFCAIPALILNVVNGHDRADGAVACFPHAVVLQVDGDESGLPVVAVDHIRPEGHVGQHPHHGSGEETEPLPVVHIAV